MNLEQGHGHGHGHRPETGLDADAGVVRALDWEGGIPNVRAGGLDPRMPQLSDAPGFVDWMRTGWGDADRTPRLEPGAADAARRHRLRLSEALAGETLIVAAGRAQLRVSDNFFEFRADSDFLWLTGYPVEDGVLVLTPMPGGHDACLYLTPPARPGDPAFHGSAAHGELWVGPLAGARELEDALGIRVRPLAELDAPEGALIAGHPVVAAGAGAKLAGRARSAVLARVLAELRMRKDDWELAELRAAVQHTIDGFAAVRREIPQAIAAGGERWLQGTFDRHARTVGQAPGYATIVGSGANAPVLHWVRADGAIDPEALLLLDMGVENRSGYTADVTRTIPAGGRFSPAQREVHDLVERAHRAGLAAVAPGRDWIDFHVACMEVVAQGLSDWGLLPVSVDEAMAPSGQQHRRYLVCGVGHHLGLDVHDCGASSFASYIGGTLEPGMALTVEPGLYFHAWDETVPPELRGIGVRIEDDLVVTPDGHEVVSSGLPIDAAGLERWMDATAT
ncbi:aminopeptidase P family protein [Agromyces aerolatus]|uniref:aminopeptidase P family protein n=1 Tax=Agromyces sp. LY-1074 TaxID=3074080 RepID=UPI00285703D7|nr:MULTISPECIES: aminopeptidase P family protein [unclassified Agromyces]MDR5701560.1 aminopeptidase P family protein [Agromyces sp. LY-1074]MDR5707833.1 aminopeptidase P family protein [Agromyces sp. LY-1358]